MLNANDLLAHLPALAVTILAYGAALAFLAGVTAVVIRLLRGDAVSFAGLSFANDERVRSLGIALDDLDRDIAVKTNVLRGIERLERQLVRLLDAPALERPAHVAEVLYDVLLECATALSSGADDYHRAALWVPAAGGEHLVMRAGYNFRADAIGAALLRIDGSLAGRAFRRNEGSISDDVASDPEFEVRPRSAARYRSLLVVPVRGDGEVAAVLSVDAQQTAYFTEDHLFYAGVFAGIAACVLSCERWELV